MKKFTSIFLCIVLIFSISTVGFAKDNSYPVIFVPGYTSSRMFIYRGTEDEKRVWKIDVADEIIDALKKEIPKVAATSSLALLGYYDALFKTLEPYANEITDYLRINDDGTSKYDVEVYPHSVETTRLDKLDEYGYHPDSDTLKMLKKYTDRKNIYCCTLDWRLGQVDNAEVLNNYVNDVIEATGAEKVNIIGVSYGGQVTASYLSLYGGDKVNNVVLHCPALDGSSIVPQLFSDGEIDLAWSDLLQLVQTFRYEEIDFSQITEIINPDFLNGFIKAFINYYLYDLFLNFGSAWDLVPLDQYVELRDKLINDGNHKSLIEKSDKYHFEVAANREKDLQKLRSEGVDISIIAGYGYRLAVDNGMNSDTVIEVASSTGATCSEIGSVLGENYKSIACGTDNHCHLSPDGCIDAATGYLPENTWYIKDMFHGLGTNEKLVSQLICDLLFTEDVTDVHSSIKYPQFMVSDNAFMGVMCTFSSCAQGYFTPYSTEMTVTNLSKESSIYIDNITASGINLNFRYSVDTPIAPGESITVKVCGELPSNDLTAFNVKIDYISLREKIRTEKSRTQSFRYSDGSLYDEILADGINEDSPVISNEHATREGKTEILNFLARIAYYIKKILSFSIFE